MLIEVPRRSVWFAALLLAAAIVPAAAGADDSNADVWDRVEHHTTKSGEIDIHYVTLGEGKPVLFLHGFPDLWYSWRHQMAALAGEFRTAAMDLRGYTLVTAPSAGHWVQLEAAGLVSNTMRAWLLARE